MVNLLICRHTDYQFSLINTAALRECHCNLETQPPLPKHFTRFMQKVVKDLKCSLLLTLETRVVLGLLKLTFLFLQAPVFSNEMLDFGCEVLNLSGENNFPL
jgi:hypothetical protein